MCLKEELRRLASKVTRVPDICRFIFFLFFEKKRINSLVFLKSKKFINQVVNLIFLL